jgi:1,4-alpha-glucan branching enzyme
MARELGRSPPRAPAGHVAIVLHAHLPYVRHPEHERSLEERWLHEALWETYLPLIDLLDRLEIEDVFAPFSLSVSPTLAAMWQDPLLASRSRDHLRRTRALAAHALAGDLGRGPLAPALRHHEALLARAAATLERHGGDVLGGFARHHRAGRIHLFTTTATHAFLPALAPSPEWVRAQIALGRRAFEAMSGVAARGIWLPECAFAPILDAALAAEGVGLTVLDAHGIALAEPRPDVVTIGGRAGARGGAEGALVVPVEPLRSAAGVTYFGRDLWAGRAVWAMDGYPSDPAYREHHRDLGFDAREEDLLGELGPFGARVATGLKLHRITGPGAEKAPYEPARARSQAAAHAAAFVGDRARLFAALAARGAARTAADETRGSLTDEAPPLSVAPFDAELFGHFWHEGPAFLEEVLRRLASSAAQGGPAAVTLIDHAERHPAALRGEPATSTWGEGGFGATWTGPETAPLWRHVHHTSAAVRDAVRRARAATGARGEAIDQAIVEALLLQSSDFAFMIHRGTTADYARARVAEHARNATRLAGLAVAGEPGPEDRAWIQAVRERTLFLRGVPPAALRAPLLGG